MAMADLDGPYNDLIKIAFPVERGWAETMFAQPLPSGHYRIDNSPFHVYGVSNGDTVSAAPDQDGRLVFTDVVQRGGHSTYRVRLPPGQGPSCFLKHWPALLALGCSFEGADGRLYAIDLPPGVPVEAVYALLAQVEQAGVWEFEEAHYASQTDQR